MLTLNELTKIWEQFQVSAIQNYYNHWENPKDLNPIAEQLIQAIKQYVKETDKNDDNERKQN